MQSVKGVMNVSQNNRKLLRFRCRLNGTIESNESAAIRRPTDRGGIFPVQTTVGSLTQSGLQSLYGDKSFGTGSNI